MKLSELEIEINKIKDFKDLTINGGVIKDTKKFIDSHLSILKSNPKKRLFLPYYERLLEFYLNNK